MYKLYHKAECLLEPLTRPSDIIQLLNDYIINRTMDEQLKFTGQFKYRQRLLMHIDI